jgi:hypothetical protein
MFHEEVVFETADGHRVDISSDTRPTGRIMLTVGSKDKLTEMRLRLSPSEQMQMAEAIFKVMLDNIRKGVIIGEPDEASGNKS